MKKICIWFIGGNSVGKSTQARLFHQKLASIMDEKCVPQLVHQRYNEVDVKLTYFSSASVNLGDLTTKVCGGTDTLNTKEQIKAGYELALKNRDIVIIEGIMATGQWIDFLKREGTVVYLILLQMNPELNFQRLRQRRAEKKGIPVSAVELSENTLYNVLGKLRGFESLYNRMCPLVDGSIRYEDNGVPANAVFNVIWKEFEKFLFTL